MTTAPVRETGHERRESHTWREIEPIILPSTWRRIDGDRTGARYRRWDGLMVIASTGFERDGREWLHVSCSRPDRLPTWEELRGVKDLFVGHKRKCIQVLPADEEYVNLHPWVLHLWCCLSEDILPDFRFIDEQGRVGI